MLLWWSIDMLLWWSIDMLLWWFIVIVDIEYDIIELLYFIVLLLQLYVFWL